METKSALTTADTSLQWTAYSGQFATVGVRHRLSRARFRTSDLSQEIEEGALAGTADAPVRGNALVPDDVPAFATAPLNQASPHRIRSCLAYNLKRSGKLNPYSKVHRKSHRLSRKAPPKEK